MRIEPATIEDVPAVLEAWSAAVAGDPLVRHFFADHPQGQRQANAEFFSPLLRVRLALDMPVMVAREKGRVAGAVIGYTAAVPERPAPLASAWDVWVAASPGLVARFDAYVAASATLAPQEPHYCPGAIGVDPRNRGTGTGRALLEAFCARSDADAASEGFASKPPTRPASRSIARPVSR